MWTPQAIVAVILALALWWMIFGAMFARWMGFDPTPEFVSMWESVMMAMIGGLMVYIGIKNGKGKDD